MATSVRMHANEYVEKRKRESQVISDEVIVNMEVDAFVSRLNDEELRSFLAVLEKYDHPLFTVWTVDDLFSSAYEVNLCRGL